MNIFLELQCLVDYFRIINVYQFLFTLSILLYSREVETRKKISCEIPFISLFLKKTVMDDLN